MKKVCIIFLLSIIISLTAYGFSGGVAASGGFDGANAGTNDVVASQYLRIHIRADSNEDSAQAVKYLVRDEIVDYLTPLVANYDTKAEAAAGVAQHLAQIEGIADKVLQQNGFSYGATAQLKTENFPTRIYGDYTLLAGEYTSLIVRLGSGEGDNWWCVIYPPLCFAAPTGQNVVYKSKIIEIINAWRERLSA